MHDLIKKIALGGLSLSLAIGSAATQAVAVDAQAAPQLPQDLSLLEDFIELNNLEALFPDVPADAESPSDLTPEARAQFDRLLATLQSNAFTNGHVAERVTDGLQLLDVQKIYDALNLNALPGAEPLLDQLGINDLVSGSNQGINGLAFLVDVITFRFQTISEGVTRTHFGLLNTPMPLDVDRRLGADVIATFGLRRAASGDLALQMKVKRKKSLLGGLTRGLFGRPAQPRDLPLDVRAVVDIPVDALIGGTQPPLRVSLGFKSGSGFPNQANLNASLSNFQGDEDLAATLNLASVKANADLSLVGSVSQESAETREFLPLAEFGVDLAPVPTEFGLNAVLGNDLNVALTSSSPTTPVIRFDAPGQASGQLVIQNLPSALNVLVGTQDEDQVVQYKASAPLDAILADLSINDGLDITAELRQLPDAATLNFGNGSAIDIDLGGAEIGEIAFTLTDGPAPRNVGEGINGAVLDMTDGLVAGARFNGFGGLTFNTDPNLSLAANIDTPLPVVFDVDLQDGGFADVDFSNFPTQVTLSLDQGDASLFGGSYTASEAVDNLSIATNLGLDLITANFEGLPMRLDLCAAQGNTCTGQTGGNVIDASLDASGPLTLNGFFCLQGDCANPEQFVQFAPLAFQKLELSADVQASEIDLFFFDIDLPEGAAGQFFINTDNAPLSGDIDADLGDTEVYITGNLRANNRRLDYDAGSFDIDTSGSLICTPLEIEVIIDGINIKDIDDDLAVDIIDLDADELLCSN